MPTGGDEGIIPTKTVYIFPPLEMIFYFLISQREILIFILNKFKKKNSVENCSQTHM